MRPNSISFKMAQRRSKAVSARAVPSGFGIAAFAFYAVAAITGAALLIGGPLAVAAALARGFAQ